MTGLMYPSIHMRGRFDWGAASSCCNCWATSNGGNGCEGGIFLFSSFVTTPPSVAVDDAAGGVGSGVSCAATWRLFSPSASVRGAAELPEAAPSSCTMPKKFNCWICFSLLSKVYSPQGQPYSWQNATGNKPNVPAMFSCHQADSVRSSKAGKHKRQH